MFKGGLYDILEFSSPAQGMNQKISPDALPLDFAYVLENFTANPLGELTPRFGTKLQISLPNLEAKIIEGFPFLKNDGSSQIILYVQEYAQDTTATTFSFINDDPYSFSFTSPNNLGRYVKDTPIKILYTLGGSLQTRIIYDIINKVQVQGNTVTITLLNNSLPRQTLNPVISNVSYSTGTIYLYDLRSNTIGISLKSNLSVGCVPRYLSYLNKLIIYNGVDKNLLWDGVTLTEIFDFVKEQTTGLTRINNTSFSFGKPDDFDISDYAVGNLIQIKVNEIPSIVTITASSMVGQLVTITVQENLPEFVNNRTIVFYKAYPPPFSFMYAAYDRLWALGTGAVSIEYRDQNEAMKVYFSYRSNSLTDWFNESTKTVPSIDLTYKNNTVDNLESISLINGYMVFAGRETTQIWTGSEPAGGIQRPGGSPLIYNSTVSTGVINGDLINELPNDTFFISKTGVQSFSTYNIAKQFAATSMDAVDPLVKEYLKNALSSNANYRSCRAFKYANGSIGGFKIGNNKVLCSLLSTSFYSWSLFSGDFLRATSFLPLGDSLYLFIDNKIYKYADGNDGNSPVYGDQNGEAIVTSGWSLPYISFKGLGFACKRYEIQADYPSSFTLRRGNKMTLQISGDLPQFYQISSPCRFDLRGDAFNTIPFTEDDHPTENSIGFRLEQPYVTFKDRFKFLASRFWLTLTVSTKDGPISIRKIRLYGIIERK